MPPPPGANPELDYLEFCSPRSGMGPMGPVCDPGGGGAHGASGNPEDAVQPDPPTDDLGGEIIEWVYNFAEGYSDQQCGTAPDGSPLLCGIPPGPGNIAKGLKAAKAARAAKPAKEVLPGPLRREFPGEHLDKSLNEIKDLVRTAEGAGKKSLQKAKKLLEQADRLMDKVGNK